MNIDQTRSELPFTPAIDLSTPAETAGYEAALEEILGDILLAIGQGIALRASFDYEAVQFVRRHFGQKFLAAMRRNGNRWAEDRANVTAVAHMYGERAVRHAKGADHITLEAAMQAAADVERYCQLHANRRAGAHGRATEGATALIAGYWCTWPE